MSNEVFDKYDNKITYMIYIYTRTKNYADLLKRKLKLRNVDEIEQIKECRNNVIISINQETL